MVVYIDLRKLSIIMDNKRAPFITEVTGYTTFLKMPKLEYLKFTKCGVSALLNGNIVFELIIVFICVFFIPECLF